MPDPATQVTTELETPEVLEIQTATGQVFKGTKDEIIEKMRESVEHGSTTLKELKQEREQLLTLAQQRAEPKVITTGFDKTKYLQLLGDDPSAAADYVDEARYGMPAAQVREAITEGREAARMLRGYQAVADFKSTIGKEYPDTQEVAQLIWKEAGVDTDPRKLTKENLVSAYMDLKASGRIKPVEAEEETTKPRKAPPSARGAGDVTRTTGGKAPEAMSLDELRASIERGRKAQGM